MLDVRVTNFPGEEFIRQYFIDSFPGRTIASIKGYNETQYDAICRVSNPDRFYYGNLTIMGTEEVFNTTNPDSGCIVAFTSGYWNSQDNVEALANNSGQLVNIMFHHLNSMASYYHFCGYMIDLEPEA